MRISFLNIVLLIGSIGLLSASPAVAQDLQRIRVTLDISKAPLSSVFEHIESQTNLLFVYPREVKQYEAVTLAGGEYSVKEALDKVLEGTSLGYRQAKNNVVIFVKDDTGDQNAPPKTGEERRVVTGRILDVTAEPIPGVNIVVQGTTRGTTSDTRGKYSIDVLGEETLVFSFIGYKAMTAVVGERTVIDVTLEQDAAMLNEVTVNGGYYQTTDKLKTGSIVKVTSKDIEKQPVTSPLMALQGRVPGLEITPSSGAPGVAPKIRIRGINSLRQFKVNATSDLNGDGNYPLYVIDGVPVSSVPLSTWDLSTSFTAGGYDPISTINPANIESIEVLKDGDATAIYGSRGANGVILITTKRNLKSSESTHVDGTVYTGIGQVSKQMNLLNLDDYLSMRREALANSGTTPEKAGALDLYIWDTTRYTNWQKVLLGNDAHITDVQINVSSGSKNTFFRFNGGYHKETLVTPGDFGYSRLSGQLSVNHVSTDQRFRMAVTSTYGLDNSNFFYIDLVNAALTLAPNAPRLYSDDGSLNWELYDLPQGKNSNTWINPLSYLRMTQDLNTRNSLSTVGVSYEFVPGLTVSAHAGYTDISSKEARKTPMSALPPAGSSVVGSAGFSDHNRNSWIVEPKLTYTQRIDGHRLNLIAGGTWQRSTNAWRVTWGEAYLSDALLGSLTGAGKVSVLRDDTNEYRYNSVYARLGYNWREKYLVNLTGRRDGSSRFGPGNRFGNFGSVGTAWIFSSEPFMQQAMPWINFGKVRASYGLTGTDNIGDYNYYSLYKVAGVKYGGLTGVVPAALHNPDYAWEVTRKLEAGLELSLAQHRLALEVNWYRNRSSNQLVNYPLSDVTGFPSVPSNFEATVQNSGWEATVRVDLLNSDSWRWMVSMNGSLPSNKLVKFDGIANSPYATIYKVGEPLSVRWLYTWTGVDKETGLHNFADENKDGYLDRSLQNLAGTVYYGGLTNTVQYKNFEVSVLIQFSHQQSTRYLPGLPGRLMNQPAEVIQRWQHSGDETTVQKYSHPFIDDIYTAEAAYRYDLLPLSNYNTTDASFIRLKTLSMAYRLPGAWLARGGLQDAKLFLQGQNLLTLTPYEGLDPETGFGLPPLRMITAGFQFKF